MKIRTQLVLLLCAALIVTTVASTWLQVRWTRRTLEAREREQATETAVEVAGDLEQHIKEDSDADDISERLKFELRRHRTVANIEFTFNSDEDTTVSYSLGFKEEEPKIKSTARPPRKPRSVAVRRDEIRRALSDHGESSLPPGTRSVEPMWRTPDRSESPEWARLRPAPAKRTPKAFFVDLRDPAQKQEQPNLEVNVPVELEGPRHGQLTLRVALESIERIARIEQVVSAAVTGAALLLLTILVLVALDRLVGKPVEELARAMRGVEGGDLSLRVAERRADEIGRLSRGFNAMIGRLSVADDEIRVFNRRLADEVRAATVDLARKNETLGHLNRLLLETRRELGDKERLAALGQLAAQLAHEIGTPLGSVSGHLQLAISERELPLPVKERLRVATRELERVSKIVRDYLDSTRPVAPARLHCDLGRLIEEAIGIAVGAGERAGLSVEHRVDKAAAQLETDPGLLRQILVNLLTNAIDACAGRERDGHILVAAQAQEADVEIAVRDDGVGIAAEDAARIFEPFYSTKGRGKGTGLGLSICRELASALGGRISVESKPGEGSTFTIRLPRATGGERRAARSA